MRILLMLTLLLVPVAWAWADDEKKENKKTADPLMGRWKAVSYEQEGRKPDEMPDYELSFKGGKYSQKNNGEEDETGSYTLNTEKRPMQVDLKIESGPDEGKKQPGIFKVEDDKLTLCLAMPGDTKRPEKFETSEEKPGILVIFKRVKE